MLTFKKDMLSSALPLKQSISLVALLKFGGILMLNIKI